MRVNGDDGEVTREPDRVVWQLSGNASERDTLDLVSSPQLATIYDPGPSQRFSLSEGSLFLSVLLRGIRPRAF